MSGSGNKDEKRRGAQRERQRLKRKDAVKNKFRLHVPDGARGQVHVIERQMVTTAIHDMQGLYDAMGVRQSSPAERRRDRSGCWAGIFCGTRS